ncbi:hypothetical protein CDD81_2732 [Ophiocordyceps australis]|uniref:Ubiquitin carrier protein n=1 Tax=Ophiocordyceps australis TaxID=1399860 RepID=A0A2C5YCX0_9HYPO|nr:hypothetical protein CDD81_2732 [Ophiocordyceps australis]
MELGLVRRVLMGPDSSPHPFQQLPSSTWIVFLADLIVLVPLFLILDYTLKTVYPVFAMVEDHHQPPVSRLTYAPASKHPIVLSPCHCSPASSSLLSIHRLLKASGGVASNLRGIACAMTHSLATTALVTIMSALFGIHVAPFASLIASLALVQLSTAWVHIVIADHPSRLPFWLRLLPIRRTLDATWRPILLRWFAIHLAHTIPLVVGANLGVNLPLDVHRVLEYGSPFPHGLLDAVVIAKALAVLAVALVCALVLIVPANVILVRIQASLLPQEYDTLVPFDRSFGDRVDFVPGVGHGYATMTDAWTTFPPSAWRRLLTLYAKILLITLAGTVLLAVFISPQVILISGKSNELDLVQD